MTNIPPYRELALYSLLCLLIQSSYGLILYPGNNSANQIAPDQARQDAFDSVARVCNDGGGGTSGSAVHLQGKYLLTANHVRVHNHNSSPTDSVTFDGVTYWEQDNTFAPIQINGADMKLFKLVKDPGLPATPLFTEITGDTLVSGTLVGWGRGRDPSIDNSGNGQTNIWAWGDNSTLAKRWGTNRIDIVATNEVVGYTYTYLLTNLDRNAGENEASLVLFDSGSGLFIDDNGTWKLAGMATAVSQADTSTFSVGGDQNFFVRITTYAADIEKEIPDKTKYSGWKIDHGLYGNDALDNADDDLDGIGLLLEFALGGDPTQNDISILPTHSLTPNGNDTYLELSLTRPKDLKDLDYTPKTTTDLLSWPNDSAGIANPTPTPFDNGNGTETLTYRRASAVDAADKAFIRVNVAESAP